MSQDRHVDLSAIRVNQAFIIVMLILAFVLDQPLVAAFVGLVMIIGTVWEGAGLFKRVYRHILYPVGIVKPDIVIDNPEPHRFAQGVGAMFVSVGTLALWVGVPVAGWGLISVVIVLANLNLWAGWCAGCMMYYWFNRLGVPGFEHERVEAA